VLADNEVDLKGQSEKRTGASWRTDRGAGSHKAERGRLQGEEEALSGAGYGSLEAEHGRVGRLKLPAKVVAELDQEAITDSERDGRAVVLPGDGYETAAGGGRGRRGRSGRQLG